MHLFFFVQRACVPRQAAIVLYTNFTTLEHSPAGPAVVQCIRALIIVLH